MSTNGVDGADGTKKAPLKSLNEAFRLAASDGEKPVVYLCAGVEDEGFDEIVTMPKGMTVYGGFDCENWEWNRTRLTVLTAPQATIPLTVSAAGGSVRIVNLHVKAPTIVIDPNIPRDTDKYNKSSIAAIADGGSVELVRCTLEAGDAAPGAPGGPADPNHPRADDGHDGSAGSAACTMLTVSPNPTPENDCGTPDDLNDDPIGGLGGSGSRNQAGPGAAGLPGDIANPNGGTRTETGMCGGGRAGNDGQPGGPGDDASGKGTLSNMGYTGSSGDDGKPGTPGQGGGGGAGAKSNGACTGSEANYGGASGGSGGNGGCGGKGGKGGGPGGSSIALVSIDTELVFQDVRLIAGSGGNGGMGSEGQLGGNGGAPGPGGDGPTALSTGCNGGTGGKGGNGGGGGKGSDGHSLAIAYLGTPPPADGFTIGAIAGGDDDGIEVFDP